MSTMRTFVFKPLWPSNRWLDIFAIFVSNIIYLRYYLKCLKQVKAYKYNTGFFQLSNPKVEIVILQ